MDSANTANDKITELFRLHADELLHMNYLYLKDRQLAEDALSETFLNAYRSLNKFKNASSEKTWLTRIAINCCKNIMRSRAYKAYKNVTDLDTELPDYTDEYSKSEAKICVSEQIAKLELKYREVILLYYYRELTAAQIAKLLKIPRTTVDYRLRYAKGILKETLKEFEL